MKIKALNEPETPSTTSDDNSSSNDNRQHSFGKEALEDKCFEKYQLALLATQDGRNDEAKELLEELNQELKDIKGDSNTLTQLRFSVLRNLGNLETNNLDYYINALEIDPSDISLWVRAGDRSMKTSSYSFARLCYEQALSLNPNNWAAIDRLVELYYVLHLPMELYDICTRALALNSEHKKALIMLEESRELLPYLHESKSLTRNTAQNHDFVVSLLNVKRKRQQQIQCDNLKFKRARLSITLDTARIQSLASFSNYIIKIYERFGKQWITRQTMIDITINNTNSFAQQMSNGGSVNSQSITQNICDIQTTSSQGAEIAMEVEGASNSENDKSDNRNEPTTSNDDNDQTKSNSRGRSNQSVQKNSSLSFAAMLFPMDLNDKRRSSRNRSNQDDTYSFKMKFDELNELLPECLRLGAIEQALQRRREEQQINTDQEESQSQSILVESNLEPVREDLIIKEVVEALSPNFGPTNNNLKLCKMFHVYLSKLSSKKQNTLPDAFVKIYKIYRRLCPLPEGVFIEINQDSLGLEELWFTLTANEITYQSQECLLLLRLLEQLKLFLDETQHKEFLVRLFLILGLHHDYKYLEIALENIEEDTRVYASNRKIITRAHIKTLIDRKTEKLIQDTIGESDDSMEIINRLAPKSENEMSDREILLLCNAIKSVKLWQRGLDILNQRNDLSSDIIIETMNLCLKNGANIDAILTSKLCKEAISGSRPTTWTCLYRGWISVLKREELLSPRNIENTNKFFELGHQTLGKKACCTIDKGEFLMLHVEHLLDDDRDCFEERDLLCSLYCLFGYPSKRPASVAGHKAQKVPMLWDYVKVLYSYLTPDELPTYMSLLRKVGITGEVESLLREIANAIPPEYNPKANVDAIENFIENGESISEIKIEKHDVTKDLYYLLADYYFKNKDFNTAKQFYHYDLVINPERFDSWAASGLLRASGVDKSLSEGTITTEDFIKGPFRKLSDSAISCFEKATSLNPIEPNATLWIEYGNLTYNLTSLTARLFTYDDFEREIDDVEPKYTNELILRHKQLYDLAKRCFESANELCVCDEVWLHFYMLGKIHEKTDTLTALEYYRKADAALFHEGASYPKKISYHNPPDLAYEAMEVHYRTYAATLKHLLHPESGEVNNSQKNLAHIKKYLLDAQRSPFVELEGTLNPKTAVHLRVEKDVDLLLEDLTDSVVDDVQFDDLVFMCLHGMKRCLVRCDKNFKALYRLSSYYRGMNDPRMAREILLGRTIPTDWRIESLARRNPHKSDFLSAPPDLCGVDSLFKDRKLGNLFFNIWRMPAEEIDRPGCFEHWMFKCTWLLIKVCRDLGDTDILNLIATQLSRQPETSKKFLQNKPRVLLALFAVKSLSSIIMEAVEQETYVERKQKIIREGMSLADKFVKANVFPDRMRDLFNQLQSLCLPGYNSQITI